MSVRATELFSQTVGESHEKFQAAAAAAGLDVQSVEHPLRGPAGEPLHAAIARLGPARAGSVLLCISGTHGVEGYAGSALQIGALRERETLLDVGADAAVVFVHQINPWGAAWSRKENEDNQELLRHQYHLHRPRPPNPVFEHFAEVMDYPSMKTLDDFMEGRRRVKKVFERYSPAQLGAALVAGHATHPQLVTFNGGPPAWSAQLLERVAREQLEGARRVVVFDLHTAMGPWGETVILENSPRDSPRHRRALGWFGEIWPSNADETYQYYEWMGDGRPDCEVMSVILECGTEQLGERDQYIFALDGWLHHFADRMSPQYADIVARYRRFFYPENAAWMESVWPHGAMRWRQITGGLRSWTAESRQKRNHA